MAGIVHAFISAVAQQGKRVIQLFINSPATEVYGYFDGQLRTGSSLPAAYQPKGLTRIKVGTNTIDPLINIGSNSSRRGWEGEIGDIRITKGVRTDFAVTPSSQAQLSIETGNTVALFRIANVNGTLMWGDVMSNTYVSLAPANVFSVSTYSTLFGGNPVLKVKNINTDYSVGPFHDGLVNTTTSNVWCTWPITIDYWARTTSNLQSRPFQFDNQDPSDPSGLFWQHAALDATRTPAEATWLYTGTGIYHVSQLYFPQPNVWTKFAIILK